MCQAFSKVADFVANDEVWSRAIIDLIKCQVVELRSSKLSSGSNVLSQATIHIPSQCTDLQNTTGKAY